MAILTINTTAPEDARVAAAYGSRLGLGRNATLAEVKAAIIQNIRDNVLLHEQQQASNAAIVGVTTIAPT